MVTYLFGDHLLEWLEMARWVVNLLLLAIFAGILVWCWKGWEQ